MLKSNELTDEALFTRLPSPETAREHLASKKDLFQNKPLADAYAKKLFSIIPDRISYGSYTNFFEGYTLKGNLRFCIEQKCYEMFLVLEELILEYLREGKEIWLFPDSKIPIFFSETLKEQVELDYFFSMDGGREGFFKDDPNDKSILSRFRKEAQYKNGRIKSNCFFYMKKQRKWFVNDFKQIARNYCSFLEEANLDDLYRYARFCQLWCEAEGRKLPNTVKSSLKEINLAREQYWRILELYPDIKEEAH